MYLIYSSIINNTVTANLSSSGTRMICVSTKGLYRLVFSKQDHLQLKECAYNHIKECSAISKECKVSGFSGHSFRFGL